MTLEELNRTSPFHAGAEIRSGAKLPGRSVPATW